MNLSEKILQLRKKNGWSQEELAEKCNVSRQSVSKWEGAASIPDLDKIILMSQMFGVTTDYLLKDDVEMEEYLSTDEPANGVRRVSLSEANEFMDLKRRSAGKIALATMICILSPIVLLLLGAISEIPKYGISEDAAGGVGLIVLMIMVAIAVTIFVVTGNSLKEYQFLKNEIFELEYGVRGVVIERWKTYKHTYNWMLAGGVVLCILSTLPLFGVMIVNPIDLYYVIATDVLLAIVSVGVFIIIETCTIKGSFDQLLQEGDYTKENKHADKLIGMVGGVYWTTVTAIYLAISFVTMRWETSWIIWPVAGVLFGAIAMICKIIKSGSER